MSEKMSEKLKDVRIGYKVVLNMGTNAKPDYESMACPVNVALKYIPYKWTHAPEGKPLFLFPTLQNALDFLAEGFVGDIFQCAYIPAPVPRVEDKQAHGIPEKSIKCAVNSNSIFASAIKLLHTKPIRFGFKAVSAIKTNLGYSTDIYSKKVFSSYNSSLGQKIIYAKNIWTKPEEGSGPLCVFSNYDDCGAFLKKDHYHRFDDISELLYVNKNVRIFRCAYIEISKHKKEHGHGVPFIKCLSNAHITKMSYPIPAGTVLCEAVMLLENNNE